MWFIYTVTANFCARYVMDSLWDTLFRPWSDEISVIHRKNTKQAHSALQHQEWNEQIPPCS